MTDTQILLIVLSSTTIALSIFIIIFTIITNKRTSTMRDQIFMSLIKCEEILKTVRTMSESSDELSEDTYNALDYIANTVESLSSSNKMVLRKMIELHENQIPEKIYPRPQLAREIDQTIKDQIDNEFMLSNKLKTPPSNYINLITTNVLKTYPNVDVEYITKRCISIIESIGKRHR